jgi:hypothetical protein
VHGYYAATQNEVQNDEITTQPRDINMPNLNARRFTNPDTLSRIKRESLIRWLAGAKDYFATREIIIPEVASQDAVPFEKIAGVFMEPDEAMPSHLMESLYMIHEMSEPHGMDAILDAVEASGLQLDVGDDPDPADVAVQAWLQKPELLEQLHNEYQLNRPKSFLYFIAEADPLPKFEPPSAQQIAALEARLNAWYVKKKRGGGCKVLVYPKGEECWFLVRHGLPCKRESAMEDGEATSIFYRPQKHDVLVYNIAAGEMRINCCGKRELDEFREAFGVHLFGDDRFFSGDAKYTLAPIVQSGKNCLVCSDVEGMADVTLKEVEFFYAGKPSHRIIRKSEDIFALVESGHLKWPEPDVLTRAVFEVAFAEAKKTRRVTIAGANRAMYGRDDDSVIVERWLKARKFVDDEIQEEAE